jgi:hypothetical protein
MSWVESIICKIGEPICVVIGTVIDFIFDWFDK